MNARRIAGLALAGTAAAALLLVGAGLAQADDNSSSNDDGYPSTQSDTQGADAGAATAGNMGDSFGDATDHAEGHGRPDGADGTDSQFGQPDPRFVEGPAGGLAKNGPLG